MIEEQHRAAVAHPYQILGLNYMSLYIRDFDAAIAFYSSVFGTPENINDQGTIVGWKMGSTWLTVFPSNVGSSPESNPRNAEFAIQVASADHVDALYAMLIAAGAKVCMEPEDTRMYEPMRFACVDDPFGVRIDIYHTRD